MVVVPYRYTSVRIKFVILPYFLVFLFLGCTEKVIRLNHLKDLLSVMYQFILLKRSFSYLKDVRSLTKV